MNVNFPIKLGRPSSAQTDWAFSIGGGTIMLALSLYALHPFEAAEILLVLPLLAAVLVVVLTSMFRYTYGEIGTNGLHYRRLWGWQNAPWSEIASVDLDPKVKNALLIRLNHGNRWQSRLRFPEVWSQTDQERQDLIDLCKAHLTHPAVITQ